MRSIYENDALVGDLTRSLMASGHRIFQIFRLGKSDAEHVAALLDLARFPQNALVLDAGSGIGAVAAEMAKQRPDLRFVLLNISSAQLALSPPHMQWCQAPMENIPFDDGTFDAVMVNYALGHADLERALAEFHRVLKPGGVLFIYDMTADDPACLLDTLSYRLHTHDAVVSTADGFDVDDVRYVDGDRSAMVGIAPPDFDRIMEGVRPVAYRFVKR